MSLATFSLNSVVRGYHVYKDYWEAATGEILRCCEERTNIHDPFAVAIIKDDSVVGHVPRKISTVCSLFLRSGGSITCEITGSRKYSHDLPQGGLEIPCSLEFTGELVKIEKVKQLFKEAPVGKTEEVKDSNTLDDVDSTITSHPDSEGGPPMKKQKIICLSEEIVDGEVVENDWVHIGKILLKTKDKDILVDGLELNDLHVNASQTLLKKQHPLVNGFTSTLKVASLNGWTPNYIQILHCATKHHWVTLTTLGCKDGEVRIYDSLFTKVDDTTLNTIAMLFGDTDVTCNVPPVQKQQGIVDCGVFAVAFATCLASGHDPSSYQFNQKEMRSHLFTCLQQQHLSEFP